MATLSTKTRQRLFSWPHINGDSGRQPYEVPNTGPGTACWNWALTGGTGGALQPKAATTIYESILDQSNYWAVDEFDKRRPGDMAGTFVNRIHNDHRYPGCGVEFTMLRNRLNAARAGNALAKHDFAIALLTIVAKVNGLAPLGPARPGHNYDYTLHNMSDSWYGWSHWGIGVRSPFTDRRVMWVQATNGVALHYGCNTMWDEHLDDYGIGIRQLPAALVAALDRVDLAPCVICLTSIQRGSWRLTDRWHQCGRCGMMYCPQDGARLGGNKFYSPCRTCQQCGGRTDMVYLGRGAARR